MKQLKTILSILVVSMIAFTTSVKAQTSPWRFGVGVEGSIPTGSIHNYSNYGLGGTAKLQYDASDNIGFTLASGYYSFQGKDSYSSLGMVPIKVGIKLFTDEQSGFYISGEVGDGIETKTFDQPVFYNTHDRFIWSPGLGVASRHWDLGARYEHYSGQGSDFGQVGLRLAYGFGL